MLASAPTSINRTASVLVVVLNATVLAVSAFVILSGTSALAAPPLGDQKEECPIPRNEWEHFGVKNNPPNCKIWTDGCNRFVKLDDRRIARTLENCFHWCPSIRCVVPETGER
jgi:hypothetical protein